MSNQYKQKGADLFKSQKQKTLLKTNWQTLIILDACRYDVFSDIITQYNLPGKLQIADSEACRTAIWYRHHWSQKHDDIVLVSGHPMIWEEKKNVNFHKAIWIDDDGIEWIKPEKTMRPAIDLQKQYPDKKFLLHLIPPHLPFMGPRGRKFGDVLMNNKYRGSQKSSRKIDGTSLYRAVISYGARNGWDILKKYYQENLIYVLDAILPYINQLRSPVILSADHGELIGEGSKYGHRGHHSLLRKVPWYEVTT